ncbi:hypothetical protein [Spirosoma pomorum]
MLFVVTIQNPAGENRPFSIWLDQLETGLDMVTRLGESGKLLGEVSIVDDTSRISLPVSLFDGTSFTPLLQQLQTQWQQILTRPLAGSVSDTDWLRQRLAAGERQLARQHSMIARLETLRVSVGRLGGFDADKQALAQQYQAARTSCQTQLLMTMLLQNRLQTMVVV